jgi:DNA-binding GntR family transcriptional regulator
MAEALATFSPVEKTETLGVRVREQLRNAIMAGLFKPGEKLTLRAVAAALGVSLTPAREALFNLAAEGILELGGNGSVYIPKLDSDAIAELTKMRTSLESLAAREALPNLTEKDIAAIRKLHLRLVKADEESDYKLLMQENWAIHFKIYHASNMPFLVKMIESCWLRTGSYLNIIYPTFAETDRGIRNHVAIMDCLERRDADALALAISRDIEFASQGFYAALADEDA